MIRVVCHRGQGARLALPWPRAVSLSFVSIRRFILLFLLFSNVALGITFDDTYNIIIIVFYMIVVSVVFSS